MAKHLCRTVAAASALLVVALVFGGAARAATPDLGPNVFVFDPSMPVSQIQATVDAIATSRSRTSSARSATRCSSSRARTARPRIPQLPGRLLHAGGGARPLARRRRHQRLGLRPQPVRRRRLRRPEQLLALAVEPHHQRHHARLRLLQRRVLGRLAGGADAAGRRERAHDADGLLHRPVVRERRLHRRLRFVATSSTARSSSGSRGTALDSWSNGVWNQVFSGVVGAPAQCFPPCGNPYTTLPTSPVTREAPYLYADSSGNWTSSRLRCRRTARGRRGSPARRPAGRSRSASSTWRSRRTPRPRSTPPSRRGLNLLLTPGVYHLNQSINVTAPTRSCSVSASRR